MDRRGCPLGEREVGFALEAVWQIGQFMHLPSQRNSGCFGEAGGVCYELLMAPRHTVD